MDDLEEDPLQVFAEPYNSLILDRLGFLGEIPHIKEFALKENIKAWVDRKSFIHNLGHAAAAYYGHYLLPNAPYMHEVLENKKVFEFARQVMYEAAELLMSVYPNEFTVEDLTHHINDLLSRFRNRSLGDTIFRVGSDLKRKLGPDDRFMATIRLAIEKKVAYGMILEAMAMGFLFHAKDENEQMFPGDVDFHYRFSENPDQVFEQICGLDATSDKGLIFQLKKQIDKLSHNNE
jgi:mannitol-1-phosphate 5-dehydrogenase